MNDWQATTTAPQRAVFRGGGGVALVRWVVKVRGDVLYVTDDTGLAEIASHGDTRRKLGISRRIAFQWNEAIQDGAVQQWGDLGEWQTWQPLPDQTCHDRAWSETP